MKKILFVLPYYKIGGTLTSFVNLLPLIDKKRYDVDVFALTNDVDDMTILPKNVNYLGFNIKESKVNTYAKGLRNKLVGLIKSGKCLLTRFGCDPSDMVFRKMAKSLSGKYDVVIAFQEGQATRMAQYILAPQKIAWVHCIYSRFKSLANGLSIDVYNHFDKIVCVSHTAVKDMVDCEPQWKDKIYVVYNAVDATYVNMKAVDDTNFIKKVNLVSIGRIDPVKRLSCIPKIAAELKGSGIIFDWWIVGGVAVQDEYDKLITRITQFDVSDCVHPIGQLSNPYPYIRASDLLVCLSSSETFNYTIAEAKVIGIPVVSTDFPCAYEFVENEKTGLILPIEQIADGIRRMLNDKNLYSEFKNRLVSNNDYHYKTKEQFELLIDE